MIKLKALGLASLILLTSGACKKRNEDATSGSDLKGFFQTEFIGEKFVLHEKSLSEDAIIEYVKRHRMADKAEDPTMPDRELAQKILMITDAFGIDPYIVTAIIRKESEYQKSAVGAGGAYGLMQIMQSVISESHVQLGQQGPQNARATTIEYLQKLMTDLYPKAVGKAFNPKPWSTAMLPVMKTDPWQNIVYGSLIFKVYLSVERTKNKTGTMKDWYTKGLQFYNGSSKKVEYTQIVMNWADAMEKEFGGVASVTAKVAEEPGTVLDQIANTSFTGNWSEAKSDKAEGGTYRHDQNSSKGSKVATFKMTGKAGIYRTYAKWVDHNGKGATNVPYEVTHLSGKSFVKINQKDGVGQWNYVGTFALDPASSVFGILNAGTDGFVSADAFKLIETDADPLIIVDSYDRDDKRITMTGSWDYKDDTEDVKQAYNRSVHIADPANGVATMTFRPNTKGKYKIGAHWIDGADHASNVKYVVHTLAGDKEFRFSQKEGGGKWVDLGEFELDATSYVLLTTEGADGLVIADAIRFDAVP